MRLYTIVNPHGGKKKGLDTLKKIKSRFDIAGCKLDIIMTEYAGHAKELASSLDFSDYDGLVIIGGDGSFHEVANGMMDRDKSDRLPIGIIPAGSGNSVARDLNLLDPIDSVAAILRAKSKPFDIIESNYNGVKKYAINIIGWGLVTDIGLKAENYRWLGSSRYTILSVLEVFKNRPRHAELIIDGVAYANDFTFIIVCNTVHTGKGMKMAPKALIDDGLIDIVVVRYGASKIHLLNTLPKVFKGTHIDDRFVDYYHGKEFSLRSDNKDTLNIDGEMIGSTPISGKVIRHALSIFR